MDFSQGHGNKFACVARGLENDTQHCCNSVAQASRNWRMIIRAASKPLRKFKDADLSAKRE